MNEVASEGFTTYDSLLSEEVLVMSVVLCFLGDSPMHAEITSTPNPGASNNPCRQCHVGVMMREQKPTIKYVKEFFGLETAPARKWDETKERVKEMWKSFKEESLAAYELKEKIYGLKDQMTIEMIELSKTPEEQARIQAIETINPNQL